MWAKLHRPLRALAQSPLRPRQTTCPRSDGARRPPTLKFGVTVVRRGRGPRILKFRCVRPIARSPRSDRANDDGNDDGNTRSLTSQITSANLEIEIHKPRRACRQTLPAEFTNLGLHLSEPSKSFFKPPLQCGHTQGFMLPNLCFFTAKPKVNVRKCSDREVVTYPHSEKIIRSGAPFTLIHMFEKSAFSIQKWFCGSLGLFLEALEGLLGALRSL